ncbi:MAG: MBL fold metallo-hydrolase [Clostridiales bacterium]|nr:MBL fold metallo-hydrolase [Clostridiales bacterium]
MGIFQQFPYTNFHELNLDKILQIVKELKQDMSDFIVNWNSQIYDQVNQWMLAHPEIYTPVAMNLEWAAAPDAKFITIDCLEKAECNVLIKNDGTFVIIDFGIRSAAQAIISAIEVYGGTKCAACILTHAHYDHIGGAGADPGYIDILSHFEKTDDFTVYTQARPMSDGTQAMDDIIADYDQFIQYCSNFATIVNPPDANTVYEIMGIPFRFYNTDIAKYYLQAPFIYNNTCLCCTIELGENKIGIYGDLYPFGQSEVAKEGVGVNNILLAPHHGSLNNMSFDFLAHVNPDYIIANRGSEDAAISELGAISGILAWTDEKGVGLYDTVQNGNIVFDLTANSARTGATTYTYPQILNDYASYRDALLYTDITPTSATSLDTLLRNMPQNSKLTCFVASTFQLAIDLGITATTSFIKITKFTGGASNNLFDRTDPDAFYFAIEITPLYDAVHTQTIYGRFVSGAYTVYPDDTGNCAIFNITTAGVITKTHESTFVTSPEDGKITLKRGGIYKVTATNVSNSSEAIISIDTISKTIPTGCTVTFLVNRAAGTYNFTAQYHTCDVFIEWVAPILTFPNI